MRARLEIWTAAICLAAPVSACAAAPKGDAFREQRLALVRSIEARGVRDSRTLAAMREVPRHEFVPAPYRALAYVDQPLPIGHDQTISQPTIVAIMTAALRPRSGMKVLEVGTGSGYQAAVLARTGCRVYSIEIIEALADSARARLGRLGFRGIEVRHGDGYRGWPEHAPFDAIMLTAAPDHLPPELVEQLAPRGRLVAPLGQEGAVQDLILLEKDARGDTTSTRLLAVRFVPLRRER